MKNICSVHTHSRLCDGTDSLSEMAWAAYEAGAVSFGASGHSHKIGRASCRERV